MKITLLAQLARLLEQLAHALGADADVLLDKVGARRVVEGHACLIGYGAGQHGLARAWRAKEQDAARHTCAQGAEASGCFRNSTSSRARAWLPRSPRRR